MGAKTWTAEDDRILTERRSKGDRWRQIALVLDRTPGAVERRFYTLFAIPADRAAERDIWEASDRLRDAIRSAYRRFANDNGITPDEAQRLLLGVRDRPQIPGTENIYKTCALQRSTAFALERAAA